MRFLYDLAIRLFGIAIFVGGIFNPKIRKRKNLQRFWQSYLPDRPVDLWMHCASLGEFDQGLPLLWEYRKHFPKARILVSFFSPSGFEHYTKRNHCVDFACVLPLDTRKNAEIFLEVTQPKTVVFVKYEFWLNILFAIQKRNISLYAVGVLFRKNQWIFKPLGGLFRKALSGFTHFFVQNEASKNLLQEIGILQVSAVGDPRFDNVMLQKNAPQEVVKTDENLKILNDICENKKVLVVGSSWQQEEEFLHAVLDQLPFEIILLAPHDIGAAHLFDIETLFGEESHRLSQMAFYRNERIILIDSIGLLTSLYRLGNLALIGGGFTGKLHNILEPAVYGLPIIFGPKYDRFPEASLFIEQGIAASFSNEAELIAAVNRMIQDLEERQKTALNLMQLQCGATHRIMAYLLSTPVHRAAPSN
jgi:3-deoxy-D-manno-octulosonic-acid transferase